ncbi:peptide ligase PGM1-related protein [Gordonia tangerina]|uniref:Peptide ligase PGM1-related protein n=1 Tax=Gordonia tangerina TaxID=2911060 RepID=A0ABS9DII7_9ACTN|nr:peptide ligase PGM1-related protein [Gordonia tangerina]MCF3938392.1 peptide ligase PGM1-related protein [Gordonia tangerina]
MNTWNTTAIELVAEPGLIYAHATAEGVVVHRSRLVRDTDPAFAPVAAELASGGYELAERVELTPDHPDALVGGSVTEFYAKVGPEDLGR